MSWSEHTIWWHVYPLGFTGAPIRDKDEDEQPRLRHLLNWLDYAIELGASGLLLGPIFDSTTHGYDTVDFWRIDPRLGTEDDFAELIAACKKLGLRVLLDGVFSHVGSEHPLVRQVLREGPHSEAAELFDIDWDAPDGPAPRVFEGHRSLARLNHQSAAAVQYTQQVMTYWLERGIDGWRLDAAYSVPTEFWAQVLPAVRSQYPEAWFLGEVIHGDYDAFVEASTIDSVTQYQLWKAIWSSLKDHNFFELDWALQRHNEFLQHFVPNTFVGNHDVSRIVSQVGRPASLLALTVLMTVGGVPSIYYGDEQAYEGIKEERLGGDDAVRPAFPQRPDQLAEEGTPIFRAHQDLIGLRRRNHWLTTGVTEALYLENSNYTYRTWAADRSTFIDVILSVEPEAQAQVRDHTGKLLWDSCHERRR